MGSASADGSEGPWFESRCVKLFSNLLKIFYLGCISWYKLPRLSFKSNSSDISWTIFRLEQKRSSLYVNFLLYERFKNAAHRLWENSRTNWDAVKRRLNRYSFHKTTKSFSNNDEVYWVAPGYKHCLCRSVPETTTPLMHVKLTGFGSFGQLIFVSPIILIDGRLGVFLLTFISGLFYKVKKNFRCG